MKHKVGDKVRIKSLAWYSENKNKYGSVHDINNSGLIFVDNMAKYCGKVATITKVRKHSYLISIENDEEVMFNWQDWMFEEESITEENMNEELNLCELLKGCEGIELYSPLFGVVTLCGCANGDIVVYSSKAGMRTFDGNGIYLTELCNSVECLLFPSKEQRDWSLFERLIPVDTPMMCSNHNSVSFILAYYKGKQHDKHYCFDGTGTSKFPGELTESCWDIIIPFDKFDPNDIEESLKYNIQK